jgi:hypothetical protein
MSTLPSLNATALLIYNLYGHFGPFHWLSVSSLITLAGGMVPVLTRRPKGRWLEWHAIFINMSFIGLVAATAAEITSRIPGTDDFFGLVVGGTSALIFALGALLMSRHMPRLISRPRFHPERTAGYTRAYPAHKAQQEQR